MGGHAFRSLSCPRFSPEVYAEVKLQTTAALETVFAHVVVPTEMPEKEDYGDIDFLVSLPRHSPSSTSMDDFDWAGTVSAIKSALNTSHGRRGILNPGCMYFAIRAPGHKDEFWVQVDVKVCFKPDLFEWETFEYNYASNSKMIGSMVKPLGLTIDPEGFHIRVEEVEQTNFPGSLVWMSKDPRDVLKITGLDRRIVDAGFKTKNEIYEYFASSWLFHPGHFAARLAEEKYYDRLEERSPHWIYFIKEWVPKHYPSYTNFTGVIEVEDSGDGKEDKQGTELQAWYKRTRAAVREKVFTLFPQVATEYYTKRAAFLKEQEEQKLRATLIAAIPQGNTGWIDDFPQPHIIIKQLEAGSDSPLIKSSAAGEPTPPLTPVQEGAEKDIALSHFILPSPATPGSPTEPWIIPLHLDPLPRTPPPAYTPRPPPANMSLEAKLVCLARWTLFNPINGAPYLLSAPRDKDFEMQWTNATDAGATEQDLVKWVKDMWWHIWIRQSHTNYVGMWKKRFEKENRKTEKKRAEEEAAKKVVELAEKEKSEIVARLERVNASLGIVDKV